MKIPYKTPNGEDCFWSVDTPLRVWIMENIAPGSIDLEAALLRDIGWEFTRLLRATVRAVGAQTQKETL